MPSVAAPLITQIITGRIEPDILVCIEHQQRVIVPSENLINAAVQIRGRPVLEHFGRAHQVLGGVVERTRALGRMSEAETLQTALGMLLVQVEIAGLASVAVLALNVLLAVALAADRVALGRPVVAALSVACALLAALDAEVVVARKALVALWPGDARSARALASGVTLGGDGALWVTLAVQAVVGVEEDAAEEAVFAVLAVLAFGVVAAVEAVAAVAATPVEVLSEFAFL